MINQPVLVLPAFQGQGTPPVYAAADLSLVDLTTALQGTGFNPNIPTLFTMEGARERSRVFEQARVSRHFLVLGGEGCALAHDEGVLIKVDEMHF